MAVSVLVVDDDDGFRALAVGMLRAAGHDPVYEAATVAEALSRAATLAPDAALIDVGLPDGDGVALARALAAPPHAARVVLISTDAEAGDDATAASIGAVAFVAKEDLEEGWLRELLTRP